jgi:signal transduction histidine kinase
VEVVEETTLVEPLPPAVEMCGLRVVQEAVTNAFRHGRAGKVWVRLAVRGDALLVTVRDDGQWVEPAAHGVGLAGMAERVAVLSGTLDVRSVAGQGVVVEAVLPLRPGEETEVRT